MRGTITMTRQEYEQLIAFLRRKYTVAKRYSHTYIRDSLSLLFGWENVRYPVEEHRICLGVCATKLIFDEYKLPGYKKQNYMIQIKGHTRN